MITKTKQAWTVGATVKVGFLSLTVKAAVATPGDFKPDAYILTNAAGTQLYKFTPYSGLEKITPTEASELLAKAKVEAHRAAARAIKQAMRQATDSAAINLIFA